MTCTRASNVTGLGNERVTRDHRIVDVFFCFRGGHDNDRDSPQCRVGLIFPKRFGFRSSWAC